MLRLILRLRLCPRKSMILVTALCRHAQVSCSYPVPATTRIRPYATVTTDGTTLTGTTTLAWITKTLVLTVAAKIVATLRRQTPKLAPASDDHSEG